MLKWSRTCTHARSPATAMPFAVTLAFVLLTLAAGSMQKTLPKLRVWLACLPDAEQGLTFRADPEAPLSHAKRKKVVLNKLAEGMAEVRALEADTSICFAEHPANAVVGWAVIQPTFICHRLRSLTPSQKLQRKFWNAVGPLEQSIFFFAITEMHPLTNPVPIKEWSCLQTHAFFSVLDEVAYADLETAWPRQRLPGSAEQDLPIDVVRLPRPFAVMCAKALWTNFAVCDMSLKASHGKGGWHLGLRGELRDGFSPVPWRVDPAEIAEFSISEPDNAAAFLDEVKHVVCSLQEQAHVDLERLLFFDSFCRICSRASGLDRIPPSWKNCP